MPLLSEPSRKRLVSLESLLRQEMAVADNSSCRIKITSRRLAEITGWTDATIRQDLSRLGIKCGASNGYDIATLYRAIRTALGTDMVSQDAPGCCIVGLGRFGSALLDYPGFQEAGCVLRAGFDESVNRVEILNAAFPLYPASRIEPVVRQEQIEYAVLTVPERDANRYARRLADAGIRGIVNCTGAVLTVPAGVGVENVSIAGALQNLLVKRREL